MAGKGKSTIASTVVQNWKYRASSAIFHFRRGQQALNARIICALARQLGTSLVPEVRNAVLESVRENEDIADQRLEEQFKTLFVAPFSKLVHRNHTILIVIDALDECEDPKDATDIVTLIGKHAPSFPTNIKFLLTCRPEGPLLRSLEPMQWRTGDLDISPDVDHDLTLFISTACARIRVAHRLDEDWPPSADVGRLVEMSQGVFQWARTALAYVSNRSPVTRLQNLLRRPWIWSGLDDLYHQILSKAFQNVEPDPIRLDLLRRVLGTLVVAPYPVSLDVIAVLYSENEVFEDMSQGEISEFLREDVLADLNSLLAVPASEDADLRLMHTSIRDLLVNEKRCQHRPYYINTILCHQQVADLSLRLMLRCLKKNICNLSNLSQGSSEIQGVAEREVSSVIRYCCRAWSIHLTEGTLWSKSGAATAAAKLDDFELFSKEKMLCWLEVMSIMGATTQAITMAKQVYQWLSVSVQAVMFSEIS